jgi:hypothetical protein
MREKRTITRPSPRFAGVAVATLAGGPLFLLGAGLSLLIDNVAAAIPVDIDFDGPDIGLILVEIPIGFIIVMIFGGILAFLPNAIGSAALTWLGKRNPGARLPVFWALAGAIAFAAPVAALNMDWAEASPDSLVPFVFTGACCALICRRGLAKESAA